MSDALIVRRSGGGGNTLKVTVVSERPFMDGTSVRRTQEVNMYLYNEWEEDWTHIYLMLDNGHEYATAYIPKNISGRSVTYQFIASTRTSGVSGGQFTLSTDNKKFSCTEYMDNILKYAALVKIE